MAYHMRQCPRCREWHRATYAGGLEWHRCEPKPRRPTHRVAPLRSTPRDLRLAKDTPRPGPKPRRSPKPPPRITTEKIHGTFAGSSGARVPHRQHRARRVGGWWIVGVAGTGLIGLGPSAVAHAIGALANLLACVLLLMAVAQSPGGRRAVTATRRGLVRAGAGVTAAAKATALLMLSNCLVAQRGVEPSTPRPNGLPDLDFAPARESARRDVADPAWWYREGCWATALLLLGHGVDGTRFAPQPTEPDFVDRYFRPELLSSDTKPSPSWNTAMKIIDGTLAWSPFPALPVGRVELPAPVRTPAPLSVPCPYCAEPATWATPDPDAPMCAPPGHTIENHEAIRCPRGGRWRRNGDRVVLLEEPGRITIACPFCGHPMMWANPRVDQGEPWVTVGHAAARNETGRWVVSCDHTGGVSTRAPLWTPATGFTEVLAGPWPTAKLRPCGGDRCVELLVLDRPGPVGIIHYPPCPQAGPEEWVP